MSAPRYARPHILDALRAAPQVLVEASAGTGKTYAIEHLVADLLLEGAPLESVLVVTFTERATAELRQRIRALLERLLAAGAGPVPEPAWTLDAAASERLERALLQFERAQVFTIHGFCQRVLHEHAFAARRPFRQTLVDGREAFGQAFRAVLREVFAVAPAARSGVVAPEARPAPDVPGGGREDLAAWLAHNRGDVARLEQLLWDVERQRAGELRPRLDAPALRAALADLDAAVGDEASREALSAAVDASSLHHSRKAWAHRALASLAGPLERYREGGSLLALLAREPLETLANMLTRLAALEAAGPLLAAAEALLAQAIHFDAAAAQLFLPAVQARAREARRREGSYDFHAMLTQVRDAVLDEEVGPGLVAALRARYRHAVIDEFQDTDEVQWAIFRRLFLESEEGHTLRAIGDPKQAIYGFRGADVYAYLRARDLLGQRAAPLALPETYRASPELARALDLLFDAGAERPFFSGPVRYPQAGVRSGRPRAVAHWGPPADADSEPAAPLHVLRLGEEGETLTAGAWRGLQGQAIAREVRRLLGLDGGPGLWVGEEDAPRRLQPEDVFVLTRSGRESHMVAAWLRRAGVPCAFYREEGLFQSQEAEDIARVLAAVLDPGDRSRRLRAWTTPFFGLTLDDLPAAADLPDDHPLLRRLYAWRTLAERGACGALLARLVEDSGLLRRELLLRERRRSLTNYEHILELLLETQARTGCDLRRLLEHLTHWRAERSLPAGEAGNVQRLESDRRAVQLMTMHKSKGLEAEVVFLFGGITAFSRDDLSLYHDRPDPNDTAPEGPEPVTVYHLEGRRVLHIGPLDDEARARVEAEAREEDQRLLYVAATRARARLCLPAVGRAVHSTRDGPLEGWAYRRLAGACYEQLNARLHDLLQAGLDPALAEVDTLPLAELPAEDPDEAPAPLPVPPWTPPPGLLQAPAAAADEARAALLRRHAPRLLTSYSRLKAAQAASAPLPAPTPAVDPEPVVAPALPPEALPGGTHTGLLLHELLELVDLDRLASCEDFASWAADPAARALCQERLAAYGLPPRHLEWTQRRVWDALGLPLPLPDGRQLPGGLCTAQVVRREEAFTFPLPEAADAEGAPPRPGRGFVRGVIDVVFADQGRLYLIDWKGDLLQDYAPPTLEACLAARYSIQLQLYSLALARLARVRDEADHEARFGGVLYCFLRGMRRQDPPGAGVLLRRPTPEEIAAFEVELARIRHERGTSS